MTMLGQGTTTTKAKARKKRKEKTLPSHAGKGKLYTEQRAILLKGPCSWIGRAEYVFCGREWLRSLTGKGFGHFIVALKRRLRPLVLQKLKSEGNRLDGARHWRDRSRSNDEWLEAKGNVSNLGFSWRGMENYRASLIFRVKRRGIKGNESGWDRFFFNLKSAHPKSD